MRSSLSNPASPSTLNFQGVTVSLILAERVMPASMPMAIRRWTGPASLAAAGIRTDTTSALVQGERLLSRRRLQWDPPALQQARPRHRDGDRPEQRLKAVFQDSAPVRPGLLRWLPATRRPAASRRTPTRSLGDPLSG